MFEEKITPEKLNFVDQVKQLGINNNCEIESITTNGDESLIIAKKAINAEKAQKDLATLIDSISKSEDIQEYIAKSISLAMVKHASLEMAFIFLYAQGYAEGMQDLFGVNLSEEISNLNLKQQEEKVL